MVFNDVIEKIGMTIDAAGVDLVLACGPLMRLLHESLSAGQRGAWAETSVDLVDHLLATVRAGAGMSLKATPSRRRGT